MNLPNTFRAFHSRNYRLYFMGQSVSLIGTWMQRTAVSWVVYILTHSTFMLGVSTFATQFPAFLLSLAGGVVSDRYNRYRVLLFTQVASLCQALSLAIYIFLHPHDANVWVIIGLGTLLGTINAFDVPARQSLVFSLVKEKDDVSNAVALNSSMVNLSRIVGPAIAGFVLQTLGEGICFLSNAASFLAVIISLLYMRLPAYQPKARTQKPLQDLRDGFSYLRANATIAGVVLMLAIMSLLVLPFNTLLPVYAKEIFKGNARTFGIIDSFIGMGALGGAIFLASLRSGANLRKVLLINTVIFGTGLILFSHETYFYLALLFAVISGFGMMSQTTISNTIIQTTADPAMRGRMVSFFAMSFFGMQPLGALLVGSISRFAGTPNTLLGQGIVAILVAAGFAWFIRSRRRQSALKVI